jgi:hypothetical protein
MASLISDSFCYLSPVIMVDHSATSLPVRRYTSLSQKKKERKKSGPSHLPIFSHMRPSAWPGIQVIVASLVFFVQGSKCRICHFRTKIPYWLPSPWDPSFMDPRDIKHETMLLFPGLHCEPIRQLCAPTKSIFLFLFNYNRHMVLFYWTFSRSWNPGLWLPRREISPRHVMDPGYRFPLLYQAGTYFKSGGLSCPTQFLHR